MKLNRRDFLKVAGFQAGALATGAGAARSTDAKPSPESGRSAPSVRRGSPEVLVVGAGAFGLWTAYYLRRRGVDVLLADQYGAGNSRATSGGETRGVRSGYRDNVLWCRWANQAIERWTEFNREWMEEYDIQLFFPTGDLTLREDWEPFTTLTRSTWDELGVEYEVLTPEEVRYRWPQIDIEGVGVALYEHRAGVVRARRVCEQVAGIYRERLGGDFRIQRVEPGRIVNGRLEDVVLRPSGERVAADRYVFALGPWFGSVFPELMGNRMRTPLGHVFYYGPPPGDDRFRFPAMPSYNVPGVTGWPALPPDSRGFRVRAGGRSPDEAGSPDTSVRHVPAEYHERPRSILREWFPDLADAPLVETRACHYESTVNREFLVDRHPDASNAWLFGGGNAEGFKFGPLLGEYVAQRVLGEDPYADVSDRFRIPEGTYD